MQHSPHSTEHAAGPQCSASAFDWQPIAAQTRILYSNSSLGDAAALGNGVGPREPRDDAVAAGQAEAQAVAAESGSCSSGSDESLDASGTEAELEQLLDEEAPAQSSHNADADSVMEPGVASRPVLPKPRPPVQHVAPGAGAMDTDFVVEAAAAGIEGPLAPSTEEAALRIAPRAPAISTATR